MSAVAALVPQDHRAPARSLPPAGELRWRADENFREMYRCLARGSETGMVVERTGGACLVATGVPVALFNPAFPPPEIAFHAGRLAAFLNGARAFYQRRALAWSVVLPGDSGGQQPSPAPTPSPRTLIAAGLRPVDALPLFAHATEREALAANAWPPARPDLEVRPARREAEIADHRALLEAAFGITERWSRRVLPPAPVSPLFTLYVAYQSGVPVGAAALCEAAGVAGVYNVATHPLQRRQGVAATLMRHVLTEARARGLGIAVLQASPAGVPLYQRLGWQQLGDYAVYVHDA